MTERHFIVGEALGQRTDKDKPSKVLRIRTPPSKRGKGIPRTREYEVGDEVVLGSEDIGINIDALIRNGTLVSVVSKVAKTPSPKTGVTADG